MEAIEVRTSQREELVDMTRRIRAEVEAAGVRDGWVLVYVRHTTAGVTVNENADRDVSHDIIEGLRRVAPRDEGWRHAEGNSDAHIKASIMGSSVVVPVFEGELALGTWQGVFLCEFDGPRTRQVLVRVSGG